jgi:hypothetical protein
VIARNLLRAGALTILMFGAALPALAAVRVTNVDRDVSAMPYTFDLGAGGALTFDSNVSGFASAYGVATTGSAQVFSVFGAPSLFQPFAETSFPSQQLGAFANFANSTAVPFSLSAGTLGFKFTLQGADYFGLAKTSGAFIDAIFVQDVAGADISLAVSEPGAVPEPGAWALLILGFGAVGATLRRRAAPAMT